MKKPSLPIPTMTDLDGMAEELAQTSDVSRGYDTPGGGDDAPPPP